LFPALKPAEREILLPVSAFGLLLFLAGVFLLLRRPARNMDFFFKDAKSMHWTPTWTVREYYSFTTQFLIAFGVAFEMPMVVLALVKLGVLTAEKLRKTRSCSNHRDLHRGGLRHTVAGSCDLSPDGRADGSSLRGLHLARSLG